MTVSTPQGWADVGKFASDWTITYSSSGKFASDWTITYSSSGKAVYATADEAVEWRAEDYAPPPVKPVKCPHCERDWHPGPLTRTVVNMLENHRFNADYNPDTDESDIVCVGADYHGPNRTRESREWTVTPATWLLPQNWTAYKSIQSTWEALNTITLGYSYTAKLYSGDWGLIGQWQVPKPKPCELPEDLPTIEFGPQNWTPPADPVALPQPVKQLVWAYWDDLTQQDIPTPERPGYDFSQYAGEISYPTSGKKAWT